MVDTRRRQIIKTPDPEGQTDAPGLEGPERFAPQPEITAPVYKENLFDKTVYLSVPTLILGFLGIMVVSFGITFLVMKWPSEGLELAENPNLQTYREAAIPQTLQAKTLPKEKPLGVENPLADIEVPDFKVSGPRPTLVGERLSERVFRVAETQVAKPPIAIIEPLKTQVRGQVFKTGETLSFPERRISTEPLGVSGPVANLEISGLRQGLNLEKTDLPGQKLLSRRFAKAAQFPKVSGEVKGLTVPTMLENRSPPILTEAFGPRSPVADLDILGAGNPQTITPIVQTPTQKLVARRYAKAVTFPQSIGDIDPLAIPVTGQGLSEKEANFSKAMGVNSPVTNLSEGMETRTIFGQTANQVQGLQENNRSFSNPLGTNFPTAIIEVNGAPNPVYQARQNPVAQKLMPRRFAKATVVPEALNLPSQTPIPPAPIITDDRLPGDASLQPWRRYAAAVPPGVEGKGKIVIIIDDMGNNSHMADQLSDLKGPLNFAFLPYAPNLETQTKNVRKKGHELLVHMPMEPRGDENPGPRALTTALGDQELLDTLDWNLTRFEGFVGVNNHMGSRFTADRRRMELVMKALKNKGLLFLDSVTTSNSEGAELARAYNLPWAGRDIFIDNVAEEEEILVQLSKVEDLARRRGVAIAIGHPHSATYHALQKWIPTLTGKNLVLVPLSSVVSQEPTQKLAGSK